MTSWKRKLASGLAVSLAVGATVAGSAGATGTSHARHAKQLTRLNLSYVPYSNDSSLFLGIKKGYFRKEGLQLSLSPAANPGVVIAGMQSGQDQLGFVTVVIAVNATAHGTKLKCVSSVDGNQGTNVAQDGTLLVANPNSGIKTVADLKGKTVATVQLASLNTLDVQEMVKEAGVNPGAVKFVSMGFAQMPQALQQGTVQAAVITSPFSATAIQNGGVLVAHPNITVMAGESTTCFAATDGYLAHHIKIAHEFQKAMTESILYTKTHLREAAATLPGYGLATSVATALQAKLGTDFNPTIKVSSVAKTERLLERFGYITPATAPDPKSIIFPGA